MSGVNLNEIQEIRKMMERNTRFLSLSGLSSIFAGGIALVGAAVARTWVSEHAQQMEYAYPTEKSLVQNLFVLAVVVLIVAVSGAYLFTIRKARKMNEKLWTPLARKIVVQFSIPLVAGGIFACAALYHHAFALVAPILLVFYGLACINASSQTFQETFGLGISILSLGLISLFYLGNGLFFWTLGFGLCHLLYGILIYLKYDRKK